VKLGILLLVLLPAALGNECKSHSSCKNCLSSGPTAGGENCLWCFEEGTEEGKRSSDGTCAVTCPTGNFNYRYADSCPSSESKFLGMEPGVGQFVVIGLPILVIIGIVVGVCCFLHHWKIEKAKKAEMDVKRARQEAGNEII